MVHLLRMYRRGFPKAWCNGTALFYCTHTYKYCATPMHAFNIIRDCTNVRDTRYISEHMRTVIHVHTIELLKDSVLLRGRESRSCDKFSPRGSSKS